MTEHVDLIPDLDSEDAFEMQMRGYSRRQVNEFVARSRSQTRDLEERLSRAIDEGERLKLELTATRQKDADNKPAYEEVSERMGQILKLADDEARAQKARALDEITKQRTDAKQEIDRFKAEAREQTERMLAAAQEQAENAIATARNEAEKTRNTARNEADRTVSDAQKKSENAVAAAKAQAKQMLDEATARATAIHDGAERRLNLLVARHTETVRRLTEVRDVVTNLVAGEVARGSLEEEVARSVASAVSSPGGSGSAPPAAGGRPPGMGDGGRHAPSTTARPASRSPLDDDQEHRAKSPAATRPATDAGHGSTDPAAGSARVGHRSTVAADLADSATARDDDTAAAKPARPASARPAGAGGLTGSSSSADSTRVTE